MFNFDVVQHEVKKDPWQFQAEGKTWRVPHIAELTWGQQLAADRGRLHEVLREVAEVLDEDGGWKPAGAEGARLLLSKHADQIGAFQAAWLAHAGMEPGESPASSS